VYNGGKGAVGGGTERDGEAVNRKGLSASERSEDTLGSHFSPKGRVFFAALDYKRKYATLHSGAAKTKRSKMFPPDTLNVRTDFVGNGTMTLLPVPSGSTYTVLYESFNTNSGDNSAFLSFQCGSTILLRVNSFAKVPSIERFKHAKCTSDITLTVASTTGNPTVTAQMLYTGRDVASSSYATSTPPALLYTFDSGEVMISFLLLCIFTLLFARFTLDSL
jgi:hypothetical protein